MPETNLNRSHVVSALTAMHAEMAGQIEHHQQEIRRIGADLVHVAATLKLVAPAMDLRSIGVKRIRQSSMGGFKFFKPGESQRIILDNLRETGRPMLTAEFIGNVIERKKLDDTPEVRATLMRTITGSLRRMAQRGLVRGEESGKGRALAWTLV